MNKIGSFDVGKIVLLFVIYVVSCFLFIVYIYILFDFSFIVFVVLILVNVCNWKGK